MWTLAFLKRYLKESGAAEARQILRRYRVVSSAIAPVETISALGRREAGDLADADVQLILRRLKKDRSYWELVDPTAEVLDRAEDVIQRVGVRTLDAVHLASAVTIQATIGRRRPILFITSDFRQREAAFGLGLRVTWVG